MSYQNQFLRNNEHKYDIKAKILHEQKLIFGIVYPKVIHENEKPEIIETIFKSNYDEIFDDFIKETKKKVECKIVAMWNPDKNIEHTFLKLKLFDVNQFLYLECKNIRSSLWALNHQE